MIFRSVHGHGGSTATVPIAPVVPIETALPVPRDRAIFVTVRYEDHAGTPVAPLGGAPGSGAGTVRGMIFYDANDNVTQATAPNGAVSTAVYDAIDRATSSTLPQDTSTSPTRTTTYTYDAVGNRLTVTTPDGKPAEGIAPLRRALDYAERTGGERLRGYLPPQLSTGPCAC